MVQSFLPKTNKKAFIIAEAGINHNGSLDSCIKMIESAADSGADAVKFQNFKTEDFIFDRSLKYTYISQGSKVEESMWDLCKRCEMKREWLPALKKICDDLNIAFLSTPTSESGVEDLVNIGVAMLKNGSDYLTHLSLLKYMGSTNLPVILSTGMANKIEIEEAISAINSGGESPITLLHCTSSYPTEIPDTNLYRMIALKETFALPVGFSDHTIGSLAAVQAVTLGASIIEKHFTLDHSFPGPDHWFSLTPSEFKQYVSDVRDAEGRLGYKDIVPSKCEKVNCQDLRLGLIASRDIKQGEVIKLDDLVIAKPGAGLPPKELDNLIGKKVTRIIKKGSSVKWDHF